MSFDSSAARHTRFLYPLGLLLIIGPLLELMGRTWPFQWYLIQWRFQAELAVLNAAPVIMLGAFVLAVVAWSNESVSVLKILGGLLLVFGIALLPLLVMLALDGIQIRQMARAELRGTIRNNAIIAGVRGLLSAVAAISFGIGAFKVAASLADDSTVRSRKGNKARGDDSLLIVEGSGS